MAGTSRVCFAGTDAGALADAVASAAEWVTPEVGPVDRPLDDVDAVVWSRPAEGDPGAADLAAGTVPVPVIAYGAADSRAAAIEAGADEFVPRDADGPAPLVDRLAALCGTSTDGDRAVGESGNAVSHGRAARVLDRVDDGVYELDAGGRFTFVNPAMAALTGYDAGELEGEHVSLVMDDDATGAALDALLSGAETEQTVECDLHRKRGPPVRIEDSMAALTGDDGTVRGVVGVVRDVTEQRALREVLSELVTASRGLMQARDREEVAEVVAGAVESVLDRELTVVRLFDRDAECLRPAGTTDAVDERVSVPVYDLGEGGPGSAFVDGDALEVPDSADVDDGRDRSVVRSELHLPMGVHGTISIGATEPDAFSDVDRRAAQLLATSAAAANRAKRESEVREARERAETLVDRINGLIEDSVEVLVEARTREEIERGVVDRLVGVDPYAFAWICRPDVAGESMTPSAWSGDPALAGAVEDTVVDRAGADPVALALEDGQLHVLEDLPAVQSGVHARASEAGMESMVAVPLTYRDAAYGVLTVYADEQDAFADREQVVLGALGRAVANAVNAVESGRILTTNRVVEMEFTVRDTDLVFGRLSARIDGTAEVAGSVYRSDEGVRLYVACEGDADRVGEFLDGDEAVVEATLVADHGDEALFEVVLADSLVETLADFGAVTRAVVAEDGVVRYTVELPYEAEARELFELVDGRYEGADLARYREHERPVRTRAEFREAVVDRFTDRQETAVRTAHLGGFFEWPRDVDGDELADAMDISRPTFHQHLRAAQRKVFEELFGTDR